MRLAAAIVLSAALATPARGAAQTTYADSTGLTWGVATFELGLVASVTSAAILAGGGSTREAQEAALIGLAVSAALGVAASIVTQVLAAPVEAPMLFHHGFTGGLLVGGLASSVLAGAGLRDQTPAWVGLAAMVAGAAGAVSYSALRMDRLAYDPALVEEAHALSWVPLPTAGVVAALLAIGGATDAAPIVGALAGIVAYAIAIGVTEDAIASEPMAMIAPLVRHEL